MPSSLTEFRAVAVANALRSCELFMGMPAEDMKSVASFAIPRRVAKGEYLFHEGTPSEGFYVVQQGAVNVHRVNSGGKEQVIHIFRSGQSFGEAALASPSGYPAEARAVENSTVILIPKADFLGLLRKRPELALRMLGAMSQHLRVLVSLLGDLTLKDVESRLANWLLKRCPHPLRATPAVIHLEGTKRVLAAELSTVSETLSRTLAKFRGEHLVRVAGRTITVLDPVRLKQVLQRNLGDTQD